MFIRVLQNDPNWHTLDCLPVPYAIDRKKLATMGGRSQPRFNAGRPGLEQASTIVWFPLKPRSRVSCFWQRLVFAR
jgi:hypothetical protein